MAVGMPGSGKSTIYNFLLKELSDVNFPSIGIPTYISSDAIIEKYAESFGKTYNEVFKDAIGPATVQLNKEVDEAIGRYANVYWDQTNLNAATRKKKLAPFPKNYTKIALYVPTPDHDEWFRRLSNRPGKTIPNHILESMSKSIEIPSLDEDFDYVFWWKD